MLNKKLVHQLVLIIVIFEYQNNKGKRGDDGAGDYREQI